MKTATTRLTLEEYLAYDDGTDNRYELIDPIKKVDCIAYLAVTELLNRNPGF